MGLLYIIKNNINGKRYIGKTTKNLDERIKQHFNCISSKVNKYHLHYAIEKYGWNNFSVDSYSFTNELLDYMEKEFIKKFDTFKNGYNMTIGGEGSAGRIVSEETRKKQSKVAKIRFKKPENHPMYGVRKFGVNNSFYGRRHSKESKDKMSRSQKERWVGEKHPMLNRKHSEKSRKKMSASRTGEGNHMFGRIGDKHPCAKEYIIIFPDGKEKLICGLCNFCRKYNLDGSAMIRVAKNIQKKHKGFRCVYKEGHSCV